MKSASVLLVDDEKEFLDAIGMGLSSRGFTVKTADNGQGALAILENYTPEIIITDLRMQPMNGFDLYQHVKKIPRLANVRFFFLTGVKDRLAEKYGLTLGAEAYFVKPVDLHELEEAITKALGKPPLS